MNVLFEEFGKTKALPKAWVKHRRTCALHKILNAANLDFEAARGTQDDADYEAVLTYLQKEVGAKPDPPLDLPMACRVHHLKAHTKLCQCKLKDAEEIFSAIISAVEKMSEEDKEKLEELSKKDPEVEQILLDAFIHRAMLAWFQQGAAEQGNSEMPEQFQADFSTVKALCAPPRHCPAPVSTPSRL